MGDSYGLGVRKRNTNPEDAPIKKFAYGAHGTVDGITVIESFLLFRFDQEER